MIVCALLTRVFLSFSFFSLQFALANVFKRSIIVYGSPFLSSVECPSPTMSTHSITTNDNNAAVGPGGSAETTTTSTTPSNDSSRTDTATPSVTLSPSRQQHQLNSMVGIYLPVLWPDQFKLWDTAHVDLNPHLKPICLLYSCGEQGEQGHFSALIPTQGMWPEPGMVPLQQWGQLPSSTRATPKSAYTHLHSASSASSAMDTNNTPSSSASADAELKLMPIRFLLQDEMTVVRQLHLLHKHLDVSVTSRGHYYARCAINRSMGYLKTGWEQFLEMAAMMYSGQEQQESISQSPEETQMTDERNYNYNQQGGGYGKASPPGDRELNSPIDSPDDDAELETELAISHSRLIYQQSLHHYTTLAHEYSFTPPGDLIRFCDLASFICQSDIESCRRARPLLRDDETAKFEELFHHLLGQSYLLRTWHAKASQHVTGGNNNSPPPPSSSTCTPFQIRDAAHRWCMLMNGQLMVWLQQRQLRSPKLPPAVIAPRPPMDATTIARGDIVPASPADSNLHAARTQHIVASAVPAAASSSDIIDRVRVTPSSVLTDVDCETARDSDPLDSIADVDSCYSDDDDEAERDERMLAQG